MPVIPTTRIEQAVGRWEGANRKRLSLSLSLQFKEKLFTLRPSGTPRDKASQQATIIRCGLGQRLVSWK